jgi:PilZ domain
VILAESYDQRVHERRQPDERTSRGRLFFGATEHDCAILNISAGGAQIRLPHPIAIWTTVTLAIANIGKLHCRVVWQRGDTVALQFVQNAHWVNGKILAAAS